MKTEVKYEGPNKITITEDTGDDRIQPGNIPQSGPNFIHQGSNFYFNPILPTAVIPQNIIVPKPEIVVEKKPVELDPLIEVEPVVENCDPEVLLSEVVVPEVIETERIPDEVEVQVQPQPFIPEAPELPIIEVIEPIAPVIIPEAPILPPLVMPEFPLQFNALPDLAVEPIIPEISIPVLPDVEIAAPLFVQEIDVTLNEIPPPPELPPLVVVEKPTIVEDKKVILIPAAPALPLEAIVPPQVVVENTVLPTVCTRNIVLDRVLPRIIYEHTQKVELISFPSARIIPVSANINRPILSLVSNP